MERNENILNRLQAIALAGVALFLAVSLFSYSGADKPDSLVFPASEGYRNWCGKIGAYTASTLFNMLGYSAYLLFAPLIALIVRTWHGQKTDQFFVRLAGMALVLVGTSALATLFITDASPGPLIGPGGYLGAMVHYLLHNYFATAGSTIVLISCIIAGLVLACDYTLIRVVLWASGVYPLGDKVVQLLRNDRRQTVKVVVPKVKTKTNGKINGKNASRSMLTEIDEPDEEEPEEACEESDEIEEDNEGGDTGEEEAGGEYDDEYDDEYETEESDDNESNDGYGGEAGQKTKSGLVNWLKMSRSQGDNAKSSSKPGTVGTEEDEDEYEEEYVLPSVDLLVKSEPHPFEQQDKTIQRQGRQLEKAFSDFGYNVKVVDVQSGPVIAQFEVQLERGLRLNKITALTDDIAIALKVPSIRIVAPIPGKNTVGVEVPNENRQLVRIREVIEETGDKVKSMAVPIFLGKDVAGNPMVIDLAKMPHLLIAGRTGTGKSVCLNSIIVSMLMTRCPDECRMILIDPKMVELSPYKSIPHLMHPVVTDMKKAEAILAWAVDKMEQRYQLLAQAGVRQLSEYNRLTEEELYRRVKPESDEEWEATPRRLPYLVIVADEMADLMMTAAKEVETHIIRLAQKSRAVGIHLVLATQKPTVDIITGLIKSNLPARIAFEVASRTDSQVVLDRNGAEKLLGNGDMLFLQPGTSLVLRGQGTYVGDQEINGIIDAVATDSPDYVIELVELQGSEDGTGGGWVDPRDDLFNEAVEYLIREGRGSLSILQRKFKIGYGRAARLIDFMEEDGIVGPHNGSQPRDITITLQQWRNRIAELEHADADSAGNSTTNSAANSAAKPQSRPAPQNTISQNTGSGKRPEKRFDENPPCEEETEDEYDGTDFYEERERRSKMRKPDRSHEIYSKRLEIPEAGYGSPATQGDCAKPKATVHTDCGMPPPKGLKLPQQPLQKPLQRSQEPVHESMSKSMRVPGGPPVNAGSNIKPNIEPGVGPVIDVDHSMLKKIQKNGKQPFQHANHRFQTPGIKYYDSDEKNETGETDDMTGEEMIGNNTTGKNMYGVVPVGDGDLRDEDDGSGENDDWEYEYVYEEVEAGDEEEEDEEDNGDNMDSEHHDVDVNAYYAEDADFESGGDWESEEDWDDGSEENTEDDEEYEYQDEDE